MTPTAPPPTQFADFLTRALESPETRAAYEDAQARSRLVDALVRMRHRLGLTQTQLARKMGIKQPAVSGFETEGSDPRLSTIQRYARSVDAVFVWQVFPKPDLVHSMDVYFERDFTVRLGVSHHEPTKRARAWARKAPYERPSLRSVA